jgi:hypothetical protein
MLAAEAVEQSRGWGGPAAILIALAAFYVFTQYREWWRLRKIQNSSPPPPGGWGDSEDPQVGVGDTDDDTADVTDDETPNAWGLTRVRLADGSVLKRRFQAVWRTGSSELPEDDEADDEDQGADEVEGETREEFADRLVAATVRYSAAVDTIVRAYGVSERTAKRDLAAAAERARG